VGQAKSKLGNTPCGTIQPNNKIPKRTPYKRDHNFMTSEPCQEYADGSEPERSVACREVVKNVGVGKSKVSGKLEKLKNSIVRPEVDDVVTGRPARTKIEHANTTALQKEGSLHLFH
jgi:hypothetical protein